MTFPLPLYSFTMKYYNFRAFVGYQLYNHSSTVPPAVLRSPPIGAQQGRCPTPETEAEQQSVEREPRRREHVSNIAIV